MFQNRHTHFKIEAYKRLKRWQLKKSVTSVLALAPLSFVWFIEVVLLQRPFNCKKVIQYQILLLKNRRSTMKKWKVN